MNRTLAVCLLFAVASTASAQTPLTTMLDESGLTYVDAGVVSPCSTPIYTVYVNIEGVIANFMVYEDAYTKETCNNVNFRMISLVTSVLDVPTGFRHPPAMLMRLAELNGNLNVGKLSIYEGDVYYSSKLWSRVADTQSLEVELLVGHIQRTALNTILAPYLEQ